MVGKPQDYLVGRIRPDESYAALVDFPAYFEIETINACNARCPMCTIEDWHRKTPTMKDALFAKIADELGANAHKVKRVSLYRDGEPLLDKKLPSRIRLLKERNIRQVAISTNVSLLDAERSAAILDAGIDLVILSIDSLNKDVFEAIRARLTLEEVLDNAQTFIAARNRLRPSTRIWVRMIRQESNQDEWPDYEAYWLDRLGPQDRVNYHNMHNWGSQLQSFKAVAESSEPTRPCVALWSLMVIFADGRVPLCNVDYNDRFPLGSVATSSIEEVWRGAALAGHRACHLAGDKGKIPICGDCNVWDEPPDYHRLDAEYSPGLVRRDASA